VVLAKEHEAAREEGHREEECAPVLFEFFGSALDLFK
jgi:hypothetical protein